MLDYCFKVMKYCTVMLQYSINGYDSLLLAVASIWTPAATIMSLSSTPAACRSLWKGAWVCSPLVRTNNHDRGM